MVVCIVVTPRRLFGDSLDTIIAQIAHLDGTPLTFGPGWVAVFSFSAGTMRLGSGMDTEAVMFHRPTREPDNKLPLTEVRDFISAVTLLCAVSGLTARETRRDSLWIYEFVEPTSA